MHLCLLCIFMRVRLVIYFKAKFLTLKSFNIRAYKFYKIDRCVFFAHLYTSGQALTKYVVP